VQTDIGNGVTQAPAWAWPLFTALLLVLLVVDLASHRGKRLRSQRAALVGTVIWVAAGLLFAVVIWRAFGAVRAGEYLAAYLVEKSLSLDNLFVFLVIFRTLGVPHDDQRAVLSWGVFGALVFRLVFILLGIAAIERYHWVVYVFAAILLWGALRVCRTDPAAQRESKAALWLTHHLPVSRALHGSRFFIREDGLLRATPLFVALCAVELTDIVFAIDSVPAALAISQNTFVVYSSNAFALLGLRSLFIVLEDALGKLKHLHYGLAAVLAFAGLKLILSRWVEIPPAASVGIIAASIGASIVSSLLARRSLRRSPA
jgi:tellurite resistance protein TerC